MNAYYREFIEGKNSVALTLCNDNEVVCYITLRIPADNLSKRRLGFVIVDDSKRGQGSLDEVHFFFGAWKELE